MIDVGELKQRILGFVEDKGPSIPVQIAREIKFDPVWASAILAELVNSKKLLMSSMKLGSTAYYLIPGQEEKLEQLADNVLSGMPKVAFLKLKQNKFLKDVDQDPQIRVALRSLKDFATPFKYGEDIYWRYNFVPKEDIERMLSSTNEEPVEEEPAAEIEEKQEEAQEENSAPSAEEKPVEEEKKIESIFTKEKSSEEKTEMLVEKVKAYLSGTNIKLIEETDSKKREFLGIGRMETELGEVELLIVAKEKKSIVEKDIEKIYEQIKESKKMVLLLTTGEIAKKAKDIYRNYKNLIRVESLR